MDLFKEMDKDARKAIEWVAAEYKYLKDVKIDLEYLEWPSKKKSDEEKAYRKLSRASRYASLCERRSEKKIEILIEDLKKAVHTYPWLRKLESDIEIPAAKLVAAFSFYTGDFRKKIKALRKKFLEQKNASGKSAEIRDAELKAAAKEIEGYIDTLIEWVRGLEISLMKLRSKKFSLLEKAKSFHGSRLEREIIAKFHELNGLRPNIDHPITVAMVLFLGFEELHHESSLEDARKMIASSPTISVFDLGCGIAFFRIFEYLGIDYTGIDLPQRAPSGGWWSVEEIKEEGGDRVVFGDFTKPKDWPKKKFDFIISLPLGSSAQIYSSILIDHLKKGGYFLDMGNFYLKVSGLGALDKFFEFGKQNIGKYHIGAVYIKAYRKK